MRSFIAPALLAAAGTQATSDPTVSFGADHVSIDIPTSMTGVQLTNFNGGSCSAADATLTESAGNLNVNFPISHCGLAMGDEVLFEIGANTQDDNSDLLNLSFFEYRVELSPEYTFTINYSYGNIAVVTSNLTDADMNVEFKLESYDSTYMNLYNVSDKLAGEPVYLGLSVDESNQAFDHSAYNFAITHCKIYHAVDRSFEYTFFDNTRDQCSNNMIDFSIDYESSVSQWRFSHLLFILNNIDGAEQEIECEVKVCHSGLSGSTCQAAAGNCLHCNPNPCDNGVCLENTAYTGFDCACDAGFDGVLCDNAL
jgi:hypothetical protein